ncbi:MAG: hypothetical protein ACYTEL_15790 [Planctomycetota bacterium]
MEQICSNCKHFLQISTVVSKHAFGDCMKPSAGPSAKNSSKKGAFKWHDDSCPDFKPRQESR